MAGVIPKSQLVNFQRWQIGSFDVTDAPAESSATTAGTHSEPAPAEAVSEPVISSPLPTAEELDQIYEDARAEGYKTGYDEGIRVGEQNRREITLAELAKLTALTGNLQISLAHMDQTIADQLLDLALEISAQVLRSSLAVRRELLLPVVREAIAALPIHHNRLTLHLNPEDAGVVREQIGEQLAQAGTHIVEDTEITSGGCSLRAGTNEIDATIETRWKRVLEALGIPPTEWLNTP